MKLPPDHEQYMRLPQKFQGQRLKDEDSLSHVTNVGERAIMLGDVQPKGTSMRAVEAELYTRLNNI